MAEAEACAEPRENGDPGRRYRGMELGEERQVARKGLFWRNEGRPERVFNDGGSSPQSPSR